MRFTLGKIISAVLLLGGAVFFLLCVDKKKERRLVLKAFYDYRKNAALRMGAEAAKCVDSGTLNYYAALIPVIINADSITVRLLNFDQKFLVLVLRHTTPLSKIRQLNGAAFFEYIIQIGLVSQENTDYSKYHYKVSLLDKNAASVQFIDSNQKAGVTFYVNKENGQWKINLPSALKYISKDVWNEIVKESGMTEDEILEWALEEQNNTKPLPRIWHPMTTYEE